MARAFTLTTILLIVAGMAIRPHFAEAQGGPADAPSTWSIVATYTIPGKASGLAWDGTYIYFGIYGANGNQVYKFNPSNGTNNLLCTGPFDDAFGMTYKSPNLVTVKQPSNSSQPALALEFNLSGTQLNTITLPDHYMSGIAWDNGTYWVCTYYPDPGKVYHIDGSGTILSQFVPPNNQPWDICLQGSDLWIADYWGDMLYKVTQTGTVLESHASQIADPAGIVFDGTYLWYCAGPLSGNSTLYKVDLQGAGTPVIAVPVNSHNYGTVTTGTSSTWNCTVQNTGTANLVITGIGVVAGEPLSSPMSFPATVSPGGSVNVPIVYSPVVPGTLNTDVSINTNDPVHPVTTVHVTGNAVIGGPHIQLSDTVHNWGERRKGSFSRWYLPVNNNGSGNLVISGLTLSDTSFRLDESVTLPITLLPLQTVQIGLWFHPDEGTDYSETLSIASNDPLQNPLTVHLNGTGVDTVYPVGTPLWTYIITGSFDNSPKAIRPIGDITGDGVDDVIVASEDNFIRCLNGNSSVTADVMWATEIYSGNVYQQNGLVIIEDINNDGYQDVIAATTGGDRSVRALSGKTGAPLWRYDTHAFGGGGWVYQVDASFDYNNDGKTDVLACAGDDANNTGPKRVFCINGLNGVPIWICPTNGPVFSVIGVEDFTGDGKPDVVAGASNEQETQGRVYGINGLNGPIVWTNVPFGSSTWALLQIDDFTGDGIKDVATGDYSGNVYFHNIVNGNRDKTTLVQSNVLVLRFENVGDVTKDSHPDFIVGHSGAKAVVIDGHDASKVWETPLMDKSWNVTGMGDITWDGYNDVAVGTLYQSNGTYFLDGPTGEELKLVTGNTPVDALDAIPDIVGDQSMELVVGGRTGGLVCLSGGYDTTTISVENRRPADRTLAVWPNPASDQVVIRYQLDGPSEVVISLTDVTGTVHLRKRSAGAAGSNSENLSLQSLAEPGLYIVSVKSPKGTRYGKFILVR